MHSVEETTSLRAAYWSFIKALADEGPSASTSCERALKLYRLALRKRRAGAKLAKIGPSRRAHMQDVRRRWRRLERRPSAQHGVVIPFPGPKG